MKKIMIIAVLAAVMLASLPASSDDCEERNHVINFRGTLLDENGMAFDGTVEVEAAFYDVPSRDMRPPLYRESFHSVAVRHGIFTLPLLRGTVEEGGVSSVISGLTDTRYVDVFVNGAVLLELHPLGTHLSAVRAEEADIAYALKDDIKLTVADIPPHNPAKVTSGTFDQARLPASRIYADFFSNGVLRYDQIPPLTAGKIGSGVFSESLIPSTLDAALFTKGIMSEDVLPSDILTDDDIYVSSGTLGHLGVIPVPTGFTRDYCQWVVGIKELDGDGGVDQFRVYTDQNGVVTCRWSPDQADAELNNYCVASYLIVCLK